MRLTVKPESTELAVGEGRRRMFSSRGEADELGLIENGILIDPVARKFWFRYPFLKSPDVLGYNRAQVLAIENHIQKGLIK